MDAHAGFEPGLLVTLISTKISCTGQNVCVFLFNTILSTAMVIMRQGDCLKSGPTDGKSQ